MGAVRALDLSRAAIWSWGCLGLVAVDEAKAEGRIPSQSTAANWKKEESMSWVTRAILCVFNAEWDFTEVRTVPKSSFQIHPCY